jgi:hypothetical protein
VLDSLVLRRRRQKKIRNNINATTTTAATIPPAIGPTLEALDVLFVSFADVGEVVAVVFVPPEAAVVVPREAAVVVAVVGVVDVAVDVPVLPERGSKGSVSSWLVGRSAMERSNDHQECSRINDIVEVHINVCIYPRRRDNQGVLSIDEIGL